MEPMICASMWGDGARFIVVTEDLVGDPRDRTVLYTAMVRHNQVISYENLPRDINLLRDDSAREENHSERP